MDLLTGSISRGYSELKKRPLIIKIALWLFCGFNIFMFFFSIHIQNMSVVMLSIVWSVLVYCAALCFLGTFISFIKFPETLKLQKYQKVFVDLDFKSKTEQYPKLKQYLEGEYINILVYQSQIPLSDWLSKRDLIETYLNLRILKIENDHRDNNITNVFVVHKELPDEIAWSDYKRYTPVDADTLALGQSYEKYITLDLNTNAHAFIAGETGSGKSKLLQGLIYQSLKKGHEVKLIDFKRGVSFAKFSDLIEVYSDYEDIVNELLKLVKITSDRYDLFVENKVEDIKEYNQLQGKTKLRRITVFIDELAELIKSSDKDVAKRINTCLETLTRVSRAAGINLIMGVQRPDSTVISGQIKNNVTYRVCGPFKDREPSVIMLGNDMATRLPRTPRGMFIVKDTDCVEFRAFHFTKESMNIQGLMPTKVVRSNRSAPVIASDNSAEPSSGVNFDFRNIEI